MKETVDNDHNEKKITCRVNQTQYEALQHKAINTNKTISCCIRECIDESLSIISAERPLTAVEKSAHLASIESMGLLRAWVRKADPQLVSAVQEGAKEKFLLLLDTD